MTIYDVSVSISGSLPVWPGDPRPNIEPAASITDGDACNLSRIIIGSHTGTHIDAPLHFIPDGISTDKVPLSTLIGPCALIEVDSGAEITRAALESADFHGRNRLLIKTKNSRLWSEKGNSFHKEFVPLSVEGAEYLANCGIILVGIDYLSVEGFFTEEGNPVHKTLLGRGIIILEGLNLSEVQPGEYELTALPLKLSGVEGSPARVVLRDGF